MPGASHTPPLGRLVRSTRERLRLTQAELAQRVGVSRAAIAELEAGRIKQPRAAVFARLSAALGIPAAVLLASTGLAGLEAATFAEIESDELIAMAVGMVRLADRDRRWLRERLDELRELIVVRRSDRRARASPKSSSGSG
jgi:transcriptional regulator with XRE-family HTH domain